MNDNVRPLRPDMVVEDARDVATAVADLRALADQIESGELAYRFGLFSYMSTTGGVTWFRAGECSLVEAVGLLSLLQHQIRDNG